MRRRTLSVLLSGVSLAAASALAAGCALVLGFEDTTLVADDDGALDGAPVDDDAGTSDRDGAASAGLSAAPSPVVVKRGASAVVTVTVDRGGAGGALTVTVADLAKGLTSAPATLPDGATRATLTISAGATAALGASTARVTLDPPIAPAIELPILVAEAPGAPDVTFGDDGAVADGSRGDAATFRAIAVQADGKIVAGGVPGAAGWFVRRFSAAGAVDASFVVPGAALPANGELRAIAIDASGRIVCAGTSSPAIGAAQMTVARLSPTGAADPTFGTGGIYRVPITDAVTGSSGFAVAVQPDGKVVVAGSRKAGAGEDGLAIRLDASGARDATFGGGLVATANSSWIGVAVEASGAIALGGTVTSANENDVSFSLLRLTAAGAPDGAFGASGALVFGSGDRASGFARMPDGALALAGASVSPGNLYVAGVVSGAGAPRFARGVAAGPGAGFFAAAAQADGRLVAAGHTAGPGGEARVERIFADGGVDEEFGEAGAQIVEPKGGQAAFDVTLFAAATQPDGRILVGGNRANAGAVLFRLWP
jgi:uncharacterized delta-60 repeat protein